MKYINFTTRMEDVYGQPDLMATTAVTHGVRGEPIPGYWYSAPELAPDNREWWRSQCGHVVDNHLRLCPVCGEVKPQVEPASQEAASRSQGDASR